MPPTPSKLATILDRQLLAFPVTPYDADGEVDLSTFRAHVRDQIEAAPAALFVCCGTGELASLTVDEHARLVEAATEEVGGTLPVLAGVGHGAHIAGPMARNTERAGVDGLLVLPPYLLSGGQEGLYRHHLDVAAATSLGLIIYQRDNAIFAPETVLRIADACPQMLGVKDGHGDVELVQRQLLAAGDRLLFLNGMPTGELFAPAYAGVGVPTYSSAVFAFVPAIARAFHTALNAGDRATMTVLLRDFYEPFAQIRRQVPGYAVSLIKAGIELRGRKVGGVRSPLVDPTPEHRAALAEVIERGLAAVPG